MDETEGWERTTPSAVGGTTRTEEDTKTQRPRSVGAREEDRLLWERTQQRGPILEPSRDDEGDRRDLLAVTEKPGAAEGDGEGDGEGSEEASEGGMEWRGP